MMKIYVEILYLATTLDISSFKQINQYTPLNRKNPSNKTLGRRVFEMTCDSGIYKHIFVLPPYAEKGVWTAKASYKGRYETVSRSIFEVEEYVLPTFGVTIDISETVILPDTKNKTITITVTAIYVYGKFVDGNVRITLNLTPRWGNSIHILGFRSQKLQSGQTSFTLPTEGILNSPGLRRSFPAGARLTVTAIVVESATGKEEAAYNDSTIFAEFPFIFGFTRSLGYYRPGMEYTLKVDMMKVNGEPAQNEKLTIRAFSGYNDTLLKEIRDVTTDSKGRAITYMNLEEFDYIYLTVKATDNQESSMFFIYPYEGKNQVLVEHKTDSDGVMQMSVFNKVQPNNIYTGMMFLIVARGKTVKATFKDADASIKSTMEIDEHVHDLINPSGRLVVFYVDRNTSEVVADSVKFELDGKCRGNKKLEVKPEQDRVSPGSDSVFTISGEPLSHVGLNVIDKALLLLNKEGILHTNTASI